MAIYPSLTNIIETTAYKTFNAEELGSHLSSDDVAENDIRIVETFPAVVFKLALNSYTRETIRVEKCNCSKCKDIDFIDHAQILQMANIYADEDKNVYIFTDKDGDPLFISAGTSTNNVEIIDITVYETLPEINLKWLVDKSVDKEFKVENMAFLDQDNKVYYIREAGFAKLFVPFMFDWFELSWPGIIVDKDNENALPITQAGFRILLQMFILQSYAWVDTAKATFALRDIFYLDIPELMSSTLGTRLNISDKQISQLLHMLPTKPYVGILEPKGQFSGGVITDYESMEYFADEHQNVSWEVFFRGMEYFGMGCTILLAPNQIIVDKDSNLIFSTEDVKEIKYRGPNFPTETKRESVEIAIFSAEIDDDLRKRLFKFFESIGVKVSSIRTSTTRTEYFKEA